MSLKTGTTTEILMVQVQNILDSCRENSCDGWWVNKKSKGTIGSRAHGSLDAQTQAEFEKGKEELKKEHQHQLEEFKQSLRSQETKWGEVGTWGLPQCCGFGSVGRRKSLVKKEDLHFLRFKLLYLYV